MELFKKYSPLISLSVGVLILLCLFIESTTLRFSSGDVAFWGISAAFGEKSDYMFSGNFAIALAYLLPLAAGLLHFFTTKLSHAKIYQYASAGLFLLAAVLLFATPVLFQSFTGLVYHNTNFGYVSASYTTNFGFGSILAAVFALGSSAAVATSALIIE